MKDPADSGGSSPRRIVPDARLRATLIAVGADSAVLGFVLYAVLSPGKQVDPTGGVEGIIAAREFVSQPETQVTVGQGGVSSRRTAGEYILRVRVPLENDKTYRFYVDPSTYADLHEGDRYHFIRPH